jgi:hypothetical protein
MFGAVNAGTESIGSQIMIDRNKKPIAVALDEPVNGLTLSKCPRCRGAGGRWQDADTALGVCNLCDGNGRVYRHDNGAYSNETDQNTYLW